MKELMSLASNTFTYKTDKGEDKEMHEVILILSEPKYRLTNQSELTREREVSEFRFFTKNVKELAKMFNWLADGSKSDKQPTLNL